MKKIVLHSPFFCFMLLQLLSSSSFAQNASKFTISGYVSEKGSKENLPGVNIYIPKLKSGTTTNTYGFYSITLPSDTVELLISYVGFQTRFLKFHLGANTVLDLELENSSLQEVVVTGTKTERISEDVQMSKIDLPIEQIKNIPALLGEKDVMKAIQLLPGVQKGSEGSSGIYVRGGGPDQNLIILDDATVYNATHLFGFFSLFNGDALKSVELTKGGFPARYGGRLSSVIDMQMKDGNKEKIKGEAGIGLLSSRLTLEGPIKKNKASFLFSARRTYIDVLARPFMKAETQGTFGYYFYDLNAKLNYIIDYKNKLYLSGYFGKDKFYANGAKDDKRKGYETKGGIDWGNATGTLRWNHLINEKLFSNVSLIFTNFLFNIGYTDKTPTSTSSLRYFSGIRDYTLKSDFDYYPNSKHTIKMGINATYHFFRPNAIVLKSNDPNSSDEFNLNNVSKINTYETAIYAEDDFKISDKWRANGGIRLSNFNVRSKSYFNPEPRISLKYAIKKDLAVKASYATMNQYIHLLSNSGIGLPSDLWVPATDRIKPQQSQQVALGFAKDLKIKEADFQISLEGYYKKSRNVIGYKEGASFLSISNVDLDGAYKFSYEDIVTVGKAESYGAELFIQKKSGKFTGWIGYTLSWTWLHFDELNFGKRFPARYDRRHDISVVGTYKFNDHITLSAVWVYGTGNAISLPTSTYTVSANPIQSNQSMNNYFQIQDYGEKNSFRMAAYHRLDVAIQFHKQRKRYERVFELGIYNAYNRKNAFYYDTRWDTKTNQTKLIQISLFPIIPSVSWTFKF
jgi:outer membrane receptor for ferrienterochelin and colicin